MLGGIENDEYIKKQKSVSFFMQSFLSFNPSCGNKLSKFFSFLLLRQRNCVMGILRIFEIFEAQLNCLPAEEKNNRVMNPTNSSCQVLLR